MRIAEIIYTHPALKELHVNLKSKRNVSEILKQKEISRNLNLVIYFSNPPTSLACY